MEEWLDKADLRLSKVTLEIGLYIRPTLIMRKEGKGVIIRGRD